MQGRSSNLVPGRRLDRYELLAPFAAGGMASIWLARQQGAHGFERLVAIKTILPSQEHQPESRATLLDEARLASRIRHTNVADVLDVGEEDGLLYIVMELVNGDSLSRIHAALKKRGEKIPMPLLLRITADACRGLHAAHELRSPKGEELHVVHRDVSPQNILLDADGVAKLIDFGIAKARDGFGEDTASGVIKGKVAFMPPEQVTGATIDRRADVWAMGAVVQFLLTGRAPFAATNELATLQKIVSGQPTEPLPADVPAPIAAAVTRALARDPADRFATAEELAQALEGGLDALGAHVSVTDVTRFMRGTLAELQEKRQSRIDAALVAADERAATSRELRGSAPDGAALAIVEDADSEAGTVLIPTLAETDLVEEGTGTSAPLVTAPTPSHARPSTRRLWPAAVIGGGALAAIAGAVLFLRPSVPTEATQAAQATSSGGAKESVDAALLPVPWDAAAPSLAVSISPPPPQPPFASVKPPTPPNPPPTKSKPSAPPAAPSNRRIIGF